MDNIALIFGSKSCEHDISVITAMQVFEKVKQENNIFLIYISKKLELYLLTESEFKDYKNIDTIIKKKKGVIFTNKGFLIKKDKKIIDVAILCTHGLNGEDGILSSVMEFYDIPYVGPSVVGASISIDKGLSFQLLDYNQISVVKSYEINKHNYLDHLSSKYGYPVIIKPNRLGSSIGIHVCYDEESFMELVLDSLKYDFVVVVQEYLKNIIELNVAVYRIKDMVYTSKIEMVKKNEDILSFKDKYESKAEGRHLFDFKIENEVSDLIKNYAIKAYETLRLNGVSRMDFMLCDGMVYLNEINSIPGALSLYLIDDYVLNELIIQAKKNYIRKTELTTSFDSSIYNCVSIKK